MTHYFLTQEQALFLAPELLGDGKAANLQTIPQPLKIEGNRLS
ncbi:MAG TPA: hypothetical protein VJA19_21895 [Pseudomonas sp.]|nr:hypothetical protein [Pseudomonas sp.]